MSQPNNDPYTNTVINSLPEHIRGSFSPEQMEALQHVLSKVNQQSRHLIDVRIQIPLYWVHYYVVFLLGRDLRSHVQETLIKRRQRSSRAAQIGFVALMSWLLIAGLAVSAFMALYLIKSALGINIFSDKHLRDFLPW